MKRFLFKTSLFFFLIIVLNHFLLLFSNYHWGNPWYSSKIEHLETKLKTKYDKLPNTYFFGSSRVYRQINPRVFDETHNKISKIKRESYNLGAPATFCPETYYLFERFLKSEIANDTDLVFLELMSVNLISKDLMQKERTTYWQNLSDIRFVLNSFNNNSDLKFKKKVKGSKDYLISYLYKQFDFNHLKFSLFNNENNMDYIGSNNDGYFSLDYNLEITKDEIVRKDLIERKNKYLNDSVLLKKRILNLINYHSVANNNFDEVNLKRVLNLIDISKSNGIELIFILPHIVLDENLINLSKKIPQKNLIDLSNPEKFPELYNDENFFDIGHLNYKGAKLFTELLVNEYFENKKSELD